MWIIIPITVIVIFVAAAIYYAVTSGSKIQALPPLPPKFPTLMPADAIGEIQKRRLPRLNTDTVTLANGEYCHYMDKAKLMKDRIIKSYHTQSHGVSRPDLLSVLFDLKWYSFRINDSESYTEVMENEITEEFRGFLYFTNRRIVFVSAKNGFDYKYKQLTAVRSYLDAIEFQFGKNYYSFLIPDGNVANQVMRLIQARRTV